MSGAHALSTGLGLESEGIEKPLNELAEWTADKVKVYPFLWKNPVTKDLHLEVHPCAISEVFVDPLPDGRHKKGALYPEGAQITDLKEELHQTLFILTNGQNDFQVKSYTLKTTFTGKKKT
ncbi:hypothetical protein C8J56DRAFT_1070346 [Mycena floridula]|nr:hypothetical protein C8J56DRAFT_1070346 [Mycena floridula]